ncbi:MAG TPA: radical SAM protein [Verrucomicrobiota bacterium]|nr:radical SAM protein [Verrucomicrobiota bacterium]HNU51342.1 radical SAM protein [Verrucomicrobiota bacterium]
MPLFHLLRARGFLGETATRDTARLPASAEYDAGAPHQIAAPAGTRTAVSLYLLLSQSCNLACTYCLNGQQTYQKSQNLRMPQQIALQAIHRFFETLAPGGALEIVFFGGEPLLNWPLAREIVVHCEGLQRTDPLGRRFRYHLTSNLTLLSRDVIEWAKRHAITFLCDVDGPPELHDACRPFRSGRGSFAAIERSLRRLRKERLAVSMRCTVTSTNQEQMAETAALHRDLGGVSSAFVPVNPVTSDEEILPADLLPCPRQYAEGLKAVFLQGLWQPEQLHPFNTYLGRVQGTERLCQACGAPYGNTPVVDVRGDVYPCIYLVGIRRFHLGQLQEAAFPRRTVLERMRAELDVRRIDGCRDCVWRGLCGGGCPVGRLTVADNPLATPDHVRYCREIACRTSQTAIEALLWHYADQHRKDQHLDRSGFPA